MTHSSRVALLLLGCLVACTCSWQAYGFATTKDVPFSELDDEGKAFVTTITGKRWYIYDSPEHKQVFFTHGEESVWEDPRSLPLTEEEKASLPKETVAEYEASLLANSPDAQAKASATTVKVVAIVPLVLFTSAIIGRILYLHMYFPELLFPARDRKRRQKNRNKTKKMKARGKMNQDNKGGRSNNV